MENPLALTPYEIALAVSTLVAVVVAVLLLLHPRGRDWDMVRSAAVVLVVLLVPFVGVVVGIGVLVRLKRLQRRRASQG